MAVAAAVRSSCVCRRSARGGSYRKNPVKGLVGRGPEQALRGGRPMQFEHAVGVS